MRQVPAEHFHDGRLSSLAFKPQPKDNQKLSVHQRSIITPKEAFQIFTEVQGYNSEDIYGVSIGEVNELSINAYKDPIKTDEGNKDYLLNKAHSLIDYNSFNKSQTDKRAKKLSLKAKDRGSLLKK